MKSVKVFFLLSSRPCSYHRRPISWPPRMCATAYTTPRSSRLTRFELNVGSVLRSEEHTSELQSPCNLVCRLLLEKKKKQQQNARHNPASTQTREEPHPKALSVRAA